MSGDWVRVAAAGDIPPGTGRYVLVGEHELAVFHIAESDQFVITRNSCPHAGGNLSAGELRGSVVTCPWHHWPFDLETGRCPLAENVELKRYPCRLEAGIVYARLEST